MIKVIEPKEAASSPEVIEFIRELLDIAYEEDITEITVFLRRGKTGILYGI